MNFNDAWKLGKWEPIRGCPGRFVLLGADPGLSPCAAFGPGVVAQRFESAEAKDQVWVAFFDDGGLISYCRAEGTWLHTLNTQAGLHRKLAQLRISPGADAARAASAARA